MTSQPLRITIWNEFVHEREDPVVGKLYPDGIHGAIAAALREKLGDAAEVSTATQDQPEHGLSAEKLAATDVLYWWGHAAHNDVSDEVVDRVQQRVLEGMGLIVLHSAHDSKIFKRLLGTRCSLRWREVGERERLWITAPGHPLVSGLPNEYIELPRAEMYGEYFDIPQPDDVIFISWFEGGEVFRSGCTFTRGAGKIFYFRPGHETYPIYYDPHIQQVLANAAQWARPSGVTYVGECRNPQESLSPIERRD
ncbi:ThuA domain-containing protein [Blastopirellula sp. J2-11]|uniref:ThuA domain-containing protein n=1 Tax=Blastopirellula sp. J2-11 TaxID=2943192 RepID=UPI0021C8C16D|nr:ThuA domain-containing protein [Blastopirellula sp. J2-11]UUO05111.1 ThuA domain-containing protein [Blastopirellula sp. J2-11]